MQASKNAFGLYEFSLTVIGPRNRRKTLKGIVDTGSTLCACTYKVITTLLIRPIDYGKVMPIGGASSSRLIYEATINFDNMSQKTPIVRLNTLPKTFDFILGMSILDFCDIDKSDNHLKICWKKTE